MRSAETVIRLVNYLGLAWVLFLRQFCSFLLRFHVLLDLLLDLVILVLHMMEVCAELQYLVRIHAARCLLGVVLVNDAEFSLVFQNLVEGSSEAVGCLEQTGHKFVVVFLRVEKRFRVGVALKRLVRVSDVKEVVAGSQFLLVGLHFLVGAAETVRRFVNGYHVHFLQVLVPALLVGRFHAELLPSQALDFRRLSRLFRVPGPLDRHKL
mmetsp:Transcript_10738/g.25109  ORF Transcript_10738/g.25109 Transcript_10738/m.25109 type:complete len:209 (-) Transcript_10738:871-1497(-)